MAEDTYQHNWSDAWLLLAIIYVSGKGATLDQIIGAGDGIEHAIFNADELESGLARLTANGYVKEKAGVFSATAKVKRAYEKTTSPRRSIRKELEGIEKLIGAAPYNAEQPHAHDLKYPGFTSAAYSKAVNDYVERAANLYNPPKASRKTKQSD